MIAVTVLSRWVVTTIWEIMGSLFIGDDGWRYQRLKLAAVGNRKVGKSGQDTYNTYNVRHSINELPVN